MTLVLQKSLVAHMEWTKKGCFSLLNSAALEWINSESLNQRLALKNNWYDARWLDSRPLRELCHKLSRSVNSHD